MPLDPLFGLANAAALAGWAAAVAGCWRPRLGEAVAGAVAVLLATAYTALILAFWSRADGGFGSLDDVAALFASRELLLAGWLHYLAFDLLVGAWQARVARAEAMPLPLLLPCLALTFLFGPAGFLLFVTLRTVRRTVAAAR